MDTTTDVRWIPVIDRVIRSGWIKATEARAWADRLGKGGVFPWMASRCVRAIGKRLKDYGWPMPWELHAEMVTNSFLLGRLTPHGPSVDIDDVD